MPYTTDTLPPDFDALDPPPSEEGREVIAARLNAAYSDAAKAGADDPERSAIARVMSEERRSRDDGDALPASSRPPVTSVVESGVRGEAIELRGIEGDRTHTLSGGQVLIIGAEQELLRATTTHQGGQSITITPAHLAEMAANANRGEPTTLIPIDFDHRSGKGPDGIAGGVILGESVRVVQRDGVDMLVGTPAYNATTAASVRRHEWLSVSPRFALAMRSKRTGEAIGAGLMALSLTNTPQLDEMRVAANFTATTALDNATGVVNASDMHQNGATTSEDEMSNTTAPTVEQVTELTADVEAKTATIVELTAKVEAADAAVAAEKTARETAEAKVAELTSVATDAESKVIALSAKAAEQGARIEAIELAAAEARIKTDVDAIAVEFNLGADQKARAERARRAGAEVWADHRAALVEFGATRQTSYGGTAAESKSVGGDWTSIIEACATERKCDAAAAVEFLNSDEGKVAYPAAEAAFESYIRN